MRLRASSWLLLLAGLLGVPIASTAQKSPARSSGPEIDG
jgi:hypothetical protein